MQKMTVNVLLSLIIQAKITGKGITGNGKLYVNLMGIIADKDSSNMTREENILNKFNNEPTKANAYRKLERYLSRFLKTGKGYPYELINFTEFEKSIGNLEKYNKYLCALREFCNKILSENKIDSFVYTLLEIIRQDENINNILYNCNYISKEDLSGSYAHPKRICVEALLLGLLYYVHKNPDESPDTELLKIPEKLTFHAVRYKDEKSLALKMPINLTDNIRETAYHQKYAEMKYNLELKYKNFVVKNLPENKNIFLYGTGGAGKTTFMMNKLGNKNKVSFYFSLYRYKEEMHYDFQSESCWVLLQILLKYHYQYEYQTYESLIANEEKCKVLQQLTELDKLLKTVPVNGNPDYTILLDGFNEMTSEFQRDFMEELEFIFDKWKNAQIIISGRTVPDCDVFNKFKCVEISGIADIELNNILFRNGIVIENEKFRKILKNPLFLNMYLENKLKVNTRGELIDAYITTQKGKSDIRFILQFVLPVVGKRMLNCYSRYEITRGEIISAVDYAIKVYINNDFVYQNYIAPKNINKKDLLDSRQNKDWVELIINNTGLMEVSVSEPHKLHFVHQYFRDYFGAKHILNSIEAIDMGYGKISSIDKKKEYAYQLDFLNIWFNEDENNGDDNDAYRLIGEISGDYHNQTCEYMFCYKTQIDTLLDICRQFNIPRASENIFRTLGISRNKVICGVNFRGISLPVSFPTYAKYSLNGKYPCDFSESHMYYNRLLDLEYTYAYSPDRSIIIFLVGCGDIAVWSFAENKLIGDYNFFEYEEDEYSFCYAEISQDNKYAVILSCFSMIQIEIATGKVVKSCFTEEELEEMTLRYENQKGTKKELEEEFVVNTVTQLDRFRNCDFTGVKFLDKEYKKILSKMGAICD